MYNKKYNSIFLVVLISLVFLICSCSSTPKQEQKAEVVPEEKIEPVVEVRNAHPYEFFDFNKDMYVTLPVKGNEVFINSILSKIAPHMSNFAMNQLISKMDKLYLSSNLPSANENNSLLFQFVAEGSFPTSYKSMLFTKGNGFRDVVETQSDKVYNYFYNDDAKFYIDIPVNGYCFADTDYLSGMLFAHEQTTTGTVFSPNWSEKAKEQMFDFSEDSVIDWYLPSASPIVNLVLGPQMKLPISFVLGTMSRIPAQPKDSLLYTVNASVEMVNSRFVKPNISIIKMLLEQIRYKDSSYGAPVVEAGEDSEILVKNLVVDLQKVVNLLDTSK